MTDKIAFTTQEKEETLALYQQVRELIDDSLIEGDVERMRHH